MNLIDKRIEKLYDLDKAKFWPVGKQTGDLLTTLVSRCKAKKVLELGTSTGVSALYMLRSISANRGKLITVESNYARYLIALESFEETKMKKFILPIFDHAPECFDYLDLNDLDFCFTDCIKKQTLEVFKIIFPLLKANAYFVVDNVLSHKDAMEDFYVYLKDHNINYDLYDFESGVIVIQKVV